MVGAAAVVVAAGLAGCGTFASDSPNATPGATVNGCVIGPNANCEGKDLVAVDLHDADLSGANLAGADLSYANLMGANLTNANLDGARLWFSVLQSADLNGASVTRANFSNANMIHATCPDGSEARNSRCDWEVLTQPTGEASPTTSPSPTPTQSVRPSPRAS